MSTSVPTSPAELRAYIVERLVGQTGEPDKVSEAAQRLVERAVPSMRETLKQDLALDLAVEIVDVELVRMSDAKPEGEGHAMAVAAAGSVPDALVATMDPDAVALIVSMLFGGDPGIAIARIQRDLSPTETVVAARVFDAIAASLRQSGGAYGDLGAVQTMSGDDIRIHALRDGPAAHVGLAVSTPAGRGAITLTMPQRLLLKATADATAQPAGSPTGQWGQRFGEEVMRSGVELQATMPLGRMTLGQIAGLQVGQVIELDADAQSRATLSARKKTLFVCEFGKLGQNYTVRIQHPFDAGQDIMDGLAAADRRQR